MTVMCWNWIRNIKSIGVTTLGKIWSRVALVACVLDRTANPTPHYYVTVTLYKHRVTVLLARKHTSSTINTSPNNKYMSNHSWSTNLGWLNAMRLNSRLDNFAVWVEADEAFFCLSGLHLFIKLNCMSRSR